MPSINMRRNSVVRGLATMVQRARIVTVSRHPTVQWMFDEIEPLLATAGHEVVPYRT
jgi:hypothetical protein